MTYLLSILYWYLLALLLALVEVQIEGPHGWAEKLPTWRPSVNHWYGRWFSKAMGGKPATGYHTAMFALVLFILHYPVLFLPWSWRLELWILSLYFLEVVVWDFLWFILNPHFRLQKFLPHHIWWHKKWWGIAPADYYLGLALSLLLAVLSGVTILWLISVGVFAVLTVVIVFVIKVCRN